MKTSELIDLLQELIKQHGDCEVYKDYWDYEKEDSDTQRVNGSYFSKCDKTIHIL